MIIPVSAPVVSEEFKAYEYKFKSVGPILHTSIGIGESPIFTMQIIWTECLQRQMFKFDVTESTTNALDFSWYIIYQINMLPLEFMLWH